MCGGDFGFEFLLEGDDLVEPEIARVIEMLDYPRVEGIVGEIILYYDRGLVEGQSQAQLEHDIGVFCTDIADDDGVFIEVLDDSFLDDAHIIGVADKVGAKICRFNDIGKDSLDVGPVQFAEQSAMADMGMTRPQTGLGEGVGSAVDLESAGEPWGLEPFFSFAIMVLLG